MGKHSTGRHQRRVVTEADGKVKQYFVREEVGNRLFTVKVNDDFYEQLHQIIEGLPAGTWSYASVVRRVVAEAAGHTLKEVGELVPTRQIDLARPKQQVEIPPSRKGLSAETKKRLLAYGPGRANIYMNSEAEGVEELALKAMAHWDQMMRGDKPAEEAV